VGEPRYVVDIAPRERTITIGTREDLLADHCLVEDPTFTNDPIPDGARVEVKVRYRSQPAPATAHRSGDRWRFEFVDRQPRPAPGQTLVIYKGEYVLGGGTIVADR